MHGLFKKKSAHGLTQVLYLHVVCIELKCYNITALWFVPLDSSCLSSSSSSELLRNVNRCEPIGWQQHGVTGLAGETAGAPKHEPCLHPLPFFCCTTVSVQKSSAILKGHWLEDQRPPSPPCCRDLSPP